MILLRSALFNLFFFGVSFVLCLIGGIWRHISPERTILIPKLWARWVIAALRVLCRVRLEVAGLRYLPQTGPALIASQHQSSFDTMVWMTLLPRCCYVLKKELTRIPLFGGMVRPAGMIVVDRHAGASAIRHLMREAERAAREDRQVVIFPEGTRAEPDRPLPLQPGVAAMATHTGLPVIPVLTDSGRCWGRRSFLKRPGVIHIVILPPIPAALGRTAIMATLDRAYRSGISPLAVDNSVGEARLGLREGAKLDS